MVCCVFGLNFKNKEFCEMYYKLLKNCGEDLLGVSM